ncbi:expressed unknown protein [Seminavis robusta]|uniref:Uncharacterized protein n=1 Tax=Seminavis robusta TaxID=568900 RepID=A0A9N8ECR2_9STRA|nr:expressed unknown protein [Seminavis robusta]|eukprot:Sro887_g216370.1 n/a (1019) ;mRNA; r:39175-42231
MRTSHREHDPRPNHGLIGTLTKSWKDEQKQLKRGASSKGKHKSYSGEFTAPTSSEEFKGLPENSPNHHASDHHVSTSKIVLTRNMRMQAINSAVRKVASEAADSQPQLQQGKSAKKKGMVRNVKNSVRSMFHKSGEDEGGDLVGDETNWNLQASSGYFGEDSARRGRSRATLEQEAEPTEAVHGDTPIASRRRTGASSRMHNKSEGVVERTRRRNTERRQRRGNRGSMSPMRGSSMRASAGSDNHHRVSTATKTNRSEQITVGSDKFNKPDHLNSVLANAQAAKETVSAAKRETMMVQQTSESRLVHADRSRSTHSSSQRPQSHHMKNFDLSASALNDFPGVAALPVPQSRQDELKHNRSTSLMDTMNAGNSNQNKVVRYSTGSIPNGLTYEAELNNSANSFPPPSPTKSRSSRVIDKGSRQRSRHSKSRHSSSSRKITSGRHQDDAMGGSFTFPGDADVKKSSNNDNKISSSFRNFVENKGKSKGAADRHSHSKIRSGSSKMRNSSSRQHHGDRVEMADRSSKRSSKRRERSKMSASDRTHVRTSSRSVEEVACKSMPSASARENTTNTRNGSHGVLLAEQQPRHVKSVHARSSRKVEPESDGDDRDHSRRSKSMPRKGSKRLVKSHENEATNDTEAKQRSSSVGRQKHKSSRQPKSTNQKERQRRKLKKQLSKEHDDQSESGSVQWSRVTKALEVKKELEKTLNPNHIDNAAALPDLVPMAKELLGKQSLEEGSNPEAPTKLEESLELAKEMQRKLNPTNQLNAALPVDHGMHVVKGLLARATSEPTVPSNTSGETRSYHPRSSEPLAKEEQLAKSCHVESAGQRSSSLPPKPANVKVRSSSSTKKKTRKSTREKSNKTSEQKDLNGSPDAKEESRGRRKKKDSHRSPSVSKRSCSASQRSSRQHSSQYKRSSTDESNQYKRSSADESHHRSRKSGNKGNSSQYKRSCTDESNQYKRSSTDESHHRSRKSGSKGSSSQYKKSSTDESNPYTRSSTDESQRSRKSGSKASMTHIDKK